MPVDFTKRHTPYEEGVDAWLLSYSDMFTLLFCFFALLVSTVFTHMDWVKIEEMMKGFSRQDQMTLTDLYEKMQQIIRDYNIQEEVEVQLSPRGVEVSFKEKASFSPGKATLKPEIYPVLNIMAQLLETKGIEKRKIFVEGHTDSVPIRTEVYPSNWELSSARAGAVVRYLNEKGLASKRFEAIGFADTKPKVALPGDQPENRRVVVVVSPEAYTSEYARIEVEVKEYKDKLQDKSATMSVEPLPVVKSTAKSPPKPVPEKSLQVDSSAVTDIPTKDSTPARTETKTVDIADKKNIMRQYFQEGQNAFKAARYTEAIAAWQKVLEIDPNHELSRRNIERAKQRMSKNAPPKKK